ncbi:MAG: hypothetical protein BWY24_00043 [Microgenomates group bacterium ADurb.Bin219]|nr:MAG: hypothetical protein BWY24_00043 [Microgenomates group bacterium ADurb.Bin219]HNP89110.1 AmmeMemoRadiSam system protein B [Candidatus Woesebacteria bacterium]
MKKKLVLLLSAILLGLSFVFFTPKSSEAPMPVIVGGIIPHHLLAEFIIDDFFVRLKKQNPESIILIGPNHEEKGGNVLSAEIDWETEFGQLKRDQYLIDRLKKGNFLNIDEKILKEEHSIIDILPFIKKNLPSVKITPLIFRGVLRLSELKKIAINLAQELDEKTIIIGSVDFSHYLSAQEAKLKDEETIEAIKNFDLERIYSFGNDHLDSPASLIIVLLASRIKGKDNLKILNHTNSGIITKNSFPPTTSYFSITFN